MPAGVTRRFSFSMPCRPCDSNARFGCAPSNASPAARRSGLATFVVVSVAETSGADITCGEELDMLGWWGHEVTGTLTLRSNACPERVETLLSEGL
ncbi:protein of unknown function [Pararobbsia alpina]